MNEYFSSEKISNIIKVNENDVEIKPITIKEKHHYISLQLDPRVNDNHTGLMKEFNNTETISRYFIHQLNNKDLFKIQSIYSKGVFVGYMGFFEDQSQPRKVFIYYSIYPKYWNQGIGTIAIKKFINICRPSLQKNSFIYIMATVKTTNKGSIAILLKNGFKKVLNENGQALIKIVNHFPANVLQYKI
jgi:RimJ/RimL family protein N-acetyltransferase